MSLISEKRLCTLIYLWFFTLKIQFFLYVIFTVIYDYLTKDFTRVNMKEFITPMNKELWKQFES